MDETRYIIAGSLIDGSGAKARRNVYLALEDDIITDIGAAADLACNNKTAIDDLSHCIILPPLVDCSMYLTRSPSIDGTPQTSSEEIPLHKKGEMLTRHSSYCHAYGVLGAVENDDITKLWKTTDTEAVLSNLIYISRSISSTRNKQPESSKDSNNNTFIKIRYSADIGKEEGATPLTSHQELCHILKHKHNKKVVVLANGRQQVTEAIGAGCDAIEQGFDMGEENLHNMAKQGVMWIPSVIQAKNGLDGAATGGDVCCRFSQRYVAPGKPAPEAEAFWKKMLTGQLAQLQFARKTGLTTAVGTGAGSIGILHGESVGEEIKLFIKAGYSLEQAIRCASAIGANFFGMEKLGRLTIGQKATFLITRGTVQQLPRKLSYLEGIYINGIPSKTYQKIPIKAV